MSDAKLMRELVREAAREPVPEVDWNRVEQRLFEKLETERAPVRTHAAGSWRPIVAVAAAAAGIAAAISFASIRSPSPTRTAAQVQALAPQPGSRLASGIIEASSLHQGDRLVADVGALTVNHPGHASWILRDASAARIERLGDVVVIALEAGAVRVEVQPRQQAESFVVRVGETAVSVHGTIFTVEKRGDRALVEVLRGSVAVGPRSRRGQSMGWLMVAPSSASFAASGVGEPEFLALPPSALEAWQAPRAAADLPNPSPQQEQLPAAGGPSHGQPLGPQAQRSPGAIASAAPTAQEPAQSPPEDGTLPESLTDAAARTSLDSLRARVADCHRRLGAVGGDGVKVSVQSNLTIMVAPDGHVTTGRFDPPLAPEVQSCAGSALLSTSFPKARSASTLTLQLRF